MRAGWVQVARGCAWIDSGTDTAKIGSADRVEAYSAGSLAAVGVPKTFPHGLGQKAKYSPRADDFRFAPDSGLNPDIAGGPVRANRRHCQQRPDTKETAN